MMINREVKTTINHWILQGKEAFLLTGARQIGKTYLIRECLKESKYDYVELNFIERPELVELFENATNAQDLLMRLSLITDKQLNKGNTIIFFDEIQEFKDIVTRIKFLVEEGSYRYIMSGSLLGVELNDLRSAPVGYLRIEDMYPLTVKEFEVDSLALANVQLHLEKAYKNFFRDPKTGFPRFKSKHHSRNSYTTNVVNGNILVESKKIRLPKLKWIAMKKHREPAEGLRLRSVTVSMEPSGKYFASLLYEGYSCENQAAVSDYSTAKILGIDYAMQGMAVFSEKIETEEAGFFRKNEKRLAREQRKLSRCVRGSHNYELQKKKVARCHEKIRNQRRDHLHKLSRKIADSYDAVAVEDIDMKAMDQCLHFGKSVQDNGYGLFREMLDYKLAWQGKKMVKVDRFFPSSKKCCKCGRIKKELKLSERVYHCECGNEMDRDRNAAINIREEARRMFTA